MKNKLLKIGVLIIVAVMLLQVISLAAIEKLTLTPTADKAKYKKGETVKITVDWKEKMESAGFDLKYDSAKLTFKGIKTATGAVLGEDFYNGDTAGKVTFNWFVISSSEASNKMIFEFEAKEETGDTTITLEDPRGFGYTGESKVISIEDVDFSSTAKISFEKVGATNENTTNTNTAKPQTPSKPANNITSTPSTTNNKATNTATNKATNKVTNKTDNTIAGGKIPYTGASTTVAFIIGTIAIIGIIYYKKYKDLAGI